MEIIFLNENQHALLEDLGVSPATLNHATCKSLFSEYDLNRIASATMTALRPTGILARYGFHPNMCKCHNDSSISIDKDPSVGYPYNSTGLDAVASDDNTIVVWETEEDLDPAKPHYMMQCNARRIVSALSTILSHVDLVKTKQFEIMILIS